MNDEIKIKQQRVKMLLQSNRLDGLLMAKQSNLQWFTGGKMNYVINNNDISLVYLYITSNKRYLIAKASDLDRMMEEELYGLGFEPALYQWYDQSPFDAIEKIKKGSRIGVDFYQPGKVMVQSKISDIRRQLTDAEIKRLIKFSADYSKIITDFCIDLKNNFTEREIAAKLIYRCSLKGIRLPVLMVGGDERIFKYRHPVYTDNKIKKLTLLATVGEKDGINVPLSRMICLGSAPRELKLKIEILNFVEASAASASTAGTLLKEVFEVIKNAYKSRGYNDEWKNHHQGGITNYVPGDYIINPGSGIKLRVGDTLSFNPTIAGAKTEDMYLVRPEKVQQLTVDRRWPNYKVSVGKDSYYKTDVLEL